MTDHLDLPRLKALSDYWADHPPMHLMVAAYLDIKPRPAPATTTPTDEDLNRVRELFPTRPLERIMTPEEWLASKGSAH